MNSLASSGHGSRARSQCRARLSALIAFLTFLPTSLALADEAPPSLSPAASTTPPPDYGPQLQALMRKIDAQSAEIDRLRAALNEEKTTARAREELLKPPPPAPVTPPPPALNYRFSGFVQADYLQNEASTDQLDPTTNQLLNQNRFLIRRARLHVDIDRGIVAGALELDANTVNGLQVRPLDMEASLRWPPRNGLSLVMATVGEFKIPYGFEIGQADTDRVFMERSNLEQAFFGGEYDLGARIQGGWRAIRYQLAVMNGNPVGEKTFPALDPTAFKDFVGRIGVDTHPFDGFSFRAGISGDKGMGFHPGTPATKPAIVYHDLDDNGEVVPGDIQVIPGEDATPSQDFGRFAIGADLGLAYAIPKVGALTIYGEATYANNMDREMFPADPIAEGRALREYGYYAALTQELFKYGAVGIRYDYYQPDIDAADNKVSNVVPRDAGVSTLALAANLQYGGGRIIFEYDHNTNNFGRTLTGTPTTLPDDQINIRGEVKF